MVVDIGSEVAIRDRRVTPWGPERGYRIGVVTQWERRPTKVSVRVGEVTVSSHVDALVEVTDSVRASVAEDNEFIRAQHLSIKAHEALGRLVQSPAREHVRYIPALRALLAALND